MALTLPNLQSGPTFDGQSIADAVDFAALVAGTDQNGVVSGGVVTAGTGMAVTIASGAGLFNGTAFTWSTSTNLAVTAASATDRKDIVVVNTSGTVAVVTGTACGTVGWNRGSVGFPPVKPNIPANSILLGEIYIAGTTSSMAAGNLIDKSVVVIPRSILYIGSATAGSGLQTGIGTGITDITGLAVTLTAVAAKLYRVSVKIAVTVGTLAATTTLTLRAGTNTVVDILDEKNGLIAAGTDLLSGYALVTPGAGAITYKASVTFSANANNQAGGGSPTGSPVLPVASIIVEQLN